MTTNQRLQPRARRESILDAALAVAQRDGYRKVTREKISERAECSVGLVTHYFRTMAQLRRAIMREAVNRKLVPIVADGLAERNPYAMKAPDNLKKLALASLS